MVTNSILCSILVVFKNVEFLILICVFASKESFLGLLVKHGIFDIVVGKLIIYIVDGHQGLMVSYPERVLNLLKVVDGVLQQSSALLFN